MMLDTKLDEAWGESEEEVTPGKRRGFGEGGWVGVSVCGLESAFGVGCLVKGGG